MLVPKSPEILTNIHGFLLTNTVFTAFIVSLIIIIAVIILSPKIKEVPSKTQVLFEIFFDFVKNFMSEQTEGDFRRVGLFFPWVMTFFILILLNNLFELIPLLGIVAIQIKNNSGTYVPLFRAANSDLNSTIALTLISVIVTQYLAFKELGFKQHMKRYFDFSKPVNIIYGLFEIISEFTKLISLSFRLYGNIYAGDVIILLFLKLAGPYFAPLPFLAFEFLVCVIQAGIFAMLTLSFMAILTGKEEINE
jgi:F-type H+-transporting ATPase subunit a